MADFPFSNDVILILAEDDDGHALLTMENLREAGVRNEILRFPDGQATLDFFLNGSYGSSVYQAGCPYLLLLDIRMPRLSGVEVLETLRRTPPFHTLPVIVLTTSDDPREVERCYTLGCNSYIVKPVDFIAFSEALRRLGKFILIIKVPDSKS